MKGKWHICRNPKCGGKFHTDKNNIVDIPCRCLAKSQQNMRDFNAKLSRLVQTGKGGTDGI